MTQIPWRWALLFGRLSSLLFIFTTSFATISFAEEAPPPFSPNPDQLEPRSPPAAPIQPSPLAPPPPPALEDLPEIEATTFTLEMLRRSTSKRIYLFDDSTRKQPPLGRILLIKEKETNKPIMGLRVMKLYPKENRVAAKRIRTYAKIVTLEEKTPYYTVEKISDIPAPPPSSQDKADLREIEAFGAKKTFMYKAPAFDPELDNDSTPHDSSERSEDDEETDSHLAITVEQPTEFETMRHWITTGFGFIRNSGPPALPGSNNFAAGNLRYGYTVKRYLYLDRPTMQDSLTVEGGFYLYKTINFVIQGDAYTVLALNLNLRYNVFFSPTLAVFGYTGLMQHNVISSSQGQLAGASSLTSMIPAVGVGVIIEVGPSWFVRGDLGFDSIGLNLILRF